MKRHALSMLVLGLLVVLAVGSMDSDNTPSSPKPTPSSPAPVPSSRRLERTPPTADETERMNRAMTKARAKLDRVISGVGMNGDFVIKDIASVSEGRVTVDLNIDLASRAAVDAYANGKLRRNTYPGFKRIYEDAMREEGFSSVSVSTLTNPFKH